ncbi:MAG: ferritin family protein [Deltaproteobacteria bacterium]|nr:ferritin family protein [Deltaproteobacteria bacterium]
MAERIIEELTIAYSTEISGYFFYTTAAVMVGDDKGKNIFAHLAKEELDHIRVIGRISESVKSGAGWIGYEEALKEDAPSKRGLPIFHAENELIKRLEKNQTDLNAVTIAIENEERAVEFYSRLLKEAQKPVEKVVLTKLLEMEKGHLKILRWESESLLKNGFWCGEMEYTVEKERE